MRGNMKRVLLILNGAEKADKVILVSLIQEFEFT